MKNPDIYTLCTQFVNLENPGMGLLPERNVCTKAQECGIVVFLNHRRQSPNQTGVLCLAVLFLLLLCKVNVPQEPCHRTLSCLDCFSLPPAVAWQLDGWGSDPFRQGGTQVPLNV